MGESDALRVCSLVFQATPETEAFWAYAESTTALLTLVDDSARTLARQDAPLSAALPLFMRVREACRHAALNYGGEGGVGGTLTPALLWDELWGEHRHAALGATFVLDIGNWRVPDGGDSVQPPFAQVAAWDEGGWMGAAMKEYVQLQVCAM